MPVLKLRDKEVVEALIYTGENEFEMRAFIEKHEDCNDFLVERRVTYRFGLEPRSTLIINFRESGSLVADVGSYVVYHPLTHTFESRRQVDMDRFEAVK